MISVSRDIGLPTGWLGTIFALGALGSIAGASRAQRLGRRTGPGRTMACGLVLYSVGAACVPLMGNAGVLAVLLPTMQQIVGDAGHTLHDVHDRTLRQAAVPAALLARADTAVRSAGQLATLAGALAGEKCDAAISCLAVAARAGVPLIVHCGEEKAAPGARRDELVNPRLVRHLLAHGTRVIVAHCASLGRAADTDQPSAPMRPAFDLFARLMDEPAWQGRLFADISAVFQRNRKPAVWQAVLQRQDWHHRLLHSSDHPLPGLMPLFSLPALQQAGVLADGDIEPLTRIREYNPLLFDFVLKRRLRLSVARLPAALFEARALI